MASPTKLPDDPHDDELRAFIDPIGHLLQRSEKGGAVGAGGDIAPDERGHSRRDTGSGAEPAKVRDAREAVERLRGAAAQGHPSAIRRYADPVRRQAGARNECSASRRSGLHRLGELAGNAAQRSRITAQAKGIRANVPGASAGATAWWYVRLPLPAGCLTRV